MGQLRSYVNMLMCLVHCAVKDTEPALRLHSSVLLKHEESYYEYVPDQLPWTDANNVCQQKLGTLATVLTGEEKSELTNFLQSLNITQAVWIERHKISQVNGGMEPLTLEFPVKSERSYARLLQHFPTMPAVTVCTHLQFNPRSYGFSTIFSYATQSSVNELMLQASITAGEDIRLALIVHQAYGPYSVAFKNDGHWHFVCMSWTRHGGEWQVMADGRVVGQGTRIYLSHIMGDGTFIIGKKQGKSGSSFRGDESFSGNITQLFIWERVLNSSEMHSLEKRCSPNSSRLIFAWNTSGLEVESSVKMHHGKVFRQGDGISQNDQLTWLQSDVLSNHSLSSEIYVQNSADCVTFNPNCGSRGLDMCDVPKGAVCQFRRDAVENFNSFSVFPTTAFFTRVNEAPLAKTVMEGYNPNATTEQVVLGLSDFARLLLAVLQTTPEVLTPIDMVYLTRTIHLMAMQVSERGVSLDAITALVTNVLELASELIDPRMAARWQDLSDEGFVVGPFNVIQSIDKLTGALADVLSADGKSFTLSSKNIVDVHLEPRKLSQLGCSCVFKPLVFDSHANNQDEILIPDTEVLRLHSLGHREVTFIHVYYSDLMGIQPKIYNTQSQRSSLRVSLATAVISAVVRDSLRGKNVPVAVHYTLSSTEVVGSSQLYTPQCVFWNFSLMSEQLDGWSSEGCWVTYSGSAVTSCFCNHTTNFAVLMNYLEAKWSPEEESVLTKMTFIGAGASLCALVVTLLLFTMLDIPKSDRTFIHKNLFLSLTAAQIVLLCSTSVTTNKVACTLVAALLHLFFMAAFSWMLVEGLLLWSKVVAVNLSEERHMKYYYLIGWGLPVLVVAITLASASGNYSSNGHCWLSVENGVIWGFAGPVIFIIMVNIMVLTRVVAIAISTARRRSIMLAIHGRPAGQAYEQIRAAMKAVLVLLPILGLTWLCGVLVPFSIVMAYIFVFLNSLQGLFIFLIYGVYNTEVRSTINSIKERRKALHFSNSPSSRPSCSRPPGSPLPGLVGHSLDEGSDRPCSSPPNSLSSPSSEVMSVVYEPSIAADIGSAVLSVNGSLGDNLPGHAPALVTPSQDAPHRECGLHVVMDVELTPCFPLSPSQRIY